MKILKFLYLLVVLLVSSTQLSFSAQVANDEFTGASLDGWSGGYKYYSGWMSIAHSATATKTFSFGSAYANQTATISFEIYTYKWDKKGGGKDYLRIHANGTEVKRYIFRTGYYTRTLTAPIDASGNLTLGFEADTTKNNERAHINYIRIDAVPKAGTPPILDSIPDQSTTTSDAFSLDLSTYSTPTEGDSITYNFSCDNTVDGLNFDSTTGLIDGTASTAGTYNCSATASDKDGTSATRNFIIAVASVGTCPGTPGLQGQYYNNRTQTLPIVLSRIDNDIDFDWGGGSPDASINNDNFSIKWSGTILIPETANYTFSLAHDDVMSLTIDGNTIYNNNTWTGGSSNFRDATPVALSAGTYPITIKFTEQGGNAYVKLAWSNDASIGSRTIIPSDNYCTTNTALVATDDQYSTSPGLTLSGVNFITDDTGNGADSGGIRPYTANTTPTTAPTQGTVTIQSDGSFTYVPDLNASGQDFFDYTITDYINNTATATVTISLPSAPPTDMNTFQRRFISNIKGNIRIIGNSVLRGSNANDTSSTTTNANLNLWYIDIDSTGTTFNSSSADINATETGVDVTHASIVWAGLYWQGYLHNDQGDTGIDSQYNFSANQATALTQIRSTINNQTVLLKINNGSYTSISPNAIGRDRQITRDGDIAAYKYAAFADVTSLLQNQAPNATYTVANIPTRTGETNTHLRDGLGNYGAWTLAVIYDNTASAVEKTRNISVYDGYVVLSAAGTNLQTIDIQGFKTPKIAPHGVDSTLSIFAGEGDRNLLGDYAKITNEDGDVYDLPDTSGAGSYFASVIEGVPQRNPILINNNGIDIHTTQVGTITGGVGAIKKNHTRASITLGTDQDTYMPSMITFATELYVPEICYDYTVQQDGFDITDSSDENRSFDAIGSGDIDINLAIKSEEGDFDFTNSKLNLALAPTDNIDFTEALYAPNNVHTYIPAILSTDHSSTKPSIAIGELPGSNGGTVKAMQKYFSKFRYTPTKDQYSGKFEFELNTTIDFGSGPVPLLLSSSQGNIKRCTQSEIYDPLYGSFNVERQDSAGTPSQKYPLYTQIAGKDFDFDVVAYKKDPAPAYSSERTLNGYTVDVELINSRPFNDANATFTCANPDPAVVQTLTAAGDKSVFAKFNGSSRVDMSSLNVQTDTALRNAAFRVWYLVDKNGTILPHTCTDPSDDSCFQTLYDTHLKADDTTLQTSGTHGFCTEETLGGGGCSSYSNTERNATGCYACLRDHFARAVCSRDNFSIRPASYRLMLSDSNESNDSSTPALSLGTNDSDSSDISPVASIAAGYRYKLEGNATSFVSDSTIARGYRRLFDNQDTDNLLSTLLFKDKAACYDTNDSYWQVFFIDGQIVGTPQGSTLALEKGNLVKHSNVGTYAYHLHDSNWTIIDQQRYAYKTFPGIDDCKPNDSSIATDSSSKSGCGIDSKLTINDGIHDATYNDLYLRFQPYRFDLSDINFSTSPADQGTLFMTDFSDPYYSTAASLSKTMAAIHEGNITAHGKDNILTTNFTDGCAASSLTIVLNRETNDTEENLETLYDVKMQQYLQYGSNLDLKITFDNNQTGKDANLTLAKTAFEDSVAPGSARVRIYTTFKKPKKDDILDGSEGIDPIKVNYLEVNASSIDANSTVHMSLNIPRGTKSFDQNITFVYGRVIPEHKLYIEKENNWKKTPLYVNIYCGQGPTICRQRYDLNTSSLSPEASSVWYQASDLFK